MTLFLFSLSGELKLDESRASPPAPTVQHLAGALQERFDVVTVTAGQVFARASWHAWFSRVGYRHPLRAWDKARITLASQRDGSTLRYEFGNERGLVVSLILLGLFAVLMSSRLNVVAGTSIAVMLVIAMSAASYAVSARETRRWLAETIHSSGTVRL